MRIVSLTRILVIGAVFGIAFLLLGSNSAIAETPEELQEKIDQKNAEIKKLEEEADRFRTEIAFKQEQGKTLASELGRIDRTIKQLQNDISVTQLK